MADNIYKETFSHVRSSYEVNVEDFEKMKTKRKAPVGKILLIAAVAAVLAAFGVTAAATDFFGLNAVTIEDGESNEGLISMQGYRDSDEYKALYDYYYGGLSLEEAAEKYGLTVPERCEVFTYEEVAGALGGDPTDGRNTRWAFYVYEDGTLGSDQEFTADDGTVIGYQMYRSVKGSLTEVSLNADSMGDDLEEWDVKLGGFDVGLVLGSDSRSLIIADLGESFFTANVLAGKRADPTFGGPITRGQLEELAGSISWETLANVAVPEFPPEEPEVQFGAGVEMDPQYIDESQSFEVTLRDYGKTHFITYMPTPEFSNVRFFLSSDGKVSDYEFHPVYNDNKSVKVAAVSFEDLNGDGNADVLVLIDYVSAIEEEYRVIRAFIYSGDGEYELDWQLSEGAGEAIASKEPDVAAVRRYCREYFSAGGQGAKDQFETEDQVVSSCTIEEGGRSYTLEAIGRRARDDDRWGIREIKVYAEGEDRPRQTIVVAGAGEDFIDGLYAGYTECPDREGVMTVQDMNFDGYPDIGVFAIIPNNTIPYYYWFWNESAGGFEYAITLQGAEVDEENRQVVATYKSGVGGSEYVYEYYEPDGDGNLMLVRTEVEMVEMYGDWVEANDYDGILDYLQSVYSDEFWLNYGLFDLTGDGTDELIATSGTCEADAMAGVWSMDTGRMRKLGAFGMGHSLLYVEDGKLIRLMGQMGFEQIWKVSYDGTEVTETLLSERQLGPEDEYRTFDVPFEMHPDSELLALHGNGRYECYLDMLDSVGEEGEYALFDLERDGTLELIVAEGDKWSFWTVEDGRAKPMGELDSTKSGLYEDEGHSLVVYYSNMSGGEIRRVYFDGEKVDTVYITGWEWHEGVAGEDPGEMVPFYPVGDRSRLS